MDPENFTGEHPERECLKSVVRVLLFRISPVHNNKTNRRGRLEGRLKILVDSRNFHSVESVGRVSWKCIT